MRRICNFGRKREVKYENKIKKQPVENTIGKKKESMQTDLNKILDNDQA